MCLNSFNHKVENCSTCHFITFMTHQKLGSRMGIVEFYLCGKMFHENNEVKIVDSSGVPDWCPRLKNKENSDVISKSE